MSSSVFFAVSVSFGSGEGFLQHRSVDRKQLTLEMPGALCTVGPDVKLSLWTSSTVKHLKMEEIIIDPLISWLHMLMGLLVCNKV